MAGSTEPITSTSTELSQGIVSSPGRVHTDAAEPAERRVDLSAGSQGLGVGEAAGEHHPAGLQPSAPHTQGVREMCDRFGGVSEDGRTGRGGDDLLVDLEKAPLEREVEVGEDPTWAQDEARRGGIVGDDIGQSEPEIDVSTVDDLEAAAHGAGRVQNRLGTHARTQKIASQQNTISGSARGCIKFPRDNGASRGTNMRSVSQAYTGSWTPIDSCLAHDVSPIFAPMRRSPWASFHPEELVLDTVRVGEIKSRLGVGDRRHCLGGRLGETQVICPFRMVGHRTSLSYTNLTVTLPSSSNSPRMLWPATTSTARVHAPGMMT